MSSGSDNTATIFVPLGNDNIAETPFYVLTWVFFGLCLVAFAIRAYIRYVCFRRLVLEDYLMLFALGMHTVEAVLIQLYVVYVYDLEAYGKGDMSRIGPNFLSNTEKGIKAFGVSVNMSIIGLLIVKLNFLLFFKRLGSSIRRFAIVWWAVTIFTIGGAAAQIGMQQFGCMFGSADYMFSEHCGSDAAVKRTLINSIFSAVVDAFSDILIVCFPIWILWGSGITLQKKLALTFVFSLVWVTIAVTIVRGSIFHQQYEGGVQIQSGTFTWFWFYIEFSVAFIIACMVSFRSLFVQRANKSSAAREEQVRREAAYRSAMRRHQQGGWRAKLHKMQDSMLDTCRTLEDWSGSDADTLAARGLPMVPSGLMTVDFHDDGNWKKSRANATMTTMTTVREGSEYGHHDDSRFDRDSAERPVSSRSLLQNLQPARVKQSVGVAR